MQDEKAYELERIAAQAKKERIKFEYICHPEDRMLQMKMGEDQTPM